MARSFATREQAIETACQNMLMARQLLPEEVYGYMVSLTKLNDLELAEVLVYSRVLLDDYYVNRWSEN